VWTQRTVVCYNLPRPPSHRRWFSPLPRRLRGGHTHSLGPRWSGEVTLFSAASLRLSTRLSGIGTSAKRDRAEGPAPSGGRAGQIEPDPAEMAQQYGAGTSVLDWRERARVLGLREPSGRYGGHRDRATVARQAISGTPYRRRRPKRGARLGFRSSGVGGRAGSGSRGAVGNFARTPRNVLTRGDSG
jgi:hypothetical protein